MSCSALVNNSVSYFYFLVIPGHAADQGTQIDDRYKSFTQLIVNLNKIFIASVLLSTISGVALSRTAAQTTLSRVFKAGCAGFGIIAALTALFGAVKLYQVLKN